MDQCRDPSVSDPSVSPSPTNSPAQHDAPVQTLHNSSAMYGDPQ